MSVSVHPLGFRYGGNPALRAPSATYRPARNEIGRLFLLDRMVESHVEAALRGMKATPLRTAITRNPDCLEIDVAYNTTVLFSDTRPKALRTHRLQEEIRRANPAGQPLGKSHSEAQARLLAAWSARSGLTPYSAVLRALPQDLRPLAALLIWVRAQGQSKGNPTNLAQALATIEATVGAVSHQSLDVDRARLVALYNQGATSVSPSQSFQGWAGLNLGVRTDGVPQTHLLGYTAGRALSFPTRSAHKVAGLGGRLLRLRAHLRGTKADDSALLDGMAYALSLHRTGNWVSEESNTSSMGHSNAVNGLDIPVTAPFDRKGAPQGPYLRILEAALASYAEQPVRLRFHRVEDPFASADALASQLARALEQRISPTMAVNTILRAARARLVPAAGGSPSAGRPGEVSPVMSGVLQGLRIQLAGPLGKKAGGQSSRVVKQLGATPFSTLGASLDYCNIPAYTKQGVVGVKVWLHYGERTTLPAPQLAPATGMPLSWGLPKTAFISGGSSA